MATDVARSNAALRVGLLLDSFAVEPWAASLLDEIDASDSLEVALFVIGAAEPRRVVLRTWFWSLYERLDRTIFRVVGAGAAPVDVRRRFRDIPAIQVGRHGRRLSMKTNDALREHDLDVLVSTLPGVPPREFANGARFGLWWIHHGDSRRGTRVTPPWDTGGEPVAPAELHVLADEGGGRRVVDRSVAPRDPASHARSQARAAWSLLASVVARLERVRRLGWSALESIDGTLDSVAAPPTNAETFRHLGRVVAYVGGKARTRAFRREQWFLAYREHAGVLTLPPSPDAFELILPPLDRFYADPHVLSVGDTSYVFFEDCPCDEEKGRISVVQIDADGARSDPVVALERPYHLSYPFVFTSKGETFLIPETLAERNVQLYRSVDFPERWERVATLLDEVDAVDATVVERDGLFWLFLARVGRGGGGDRLELYSSVRLTDGWRPHPENPIVSDVRAARPAGGLFVHDGRLIRPAQDSSVQYGHSTVFNEVLRLDQGHYRERAVAKLEPSWRSDINGTHCYSVDARLEVIDVRRVIPRRALVSRSGG